MEYNLKNLSLLLRVTIFASLAYDNQSFSFYLTSCNRLVFGVRLLVIYTSNH